MDFAGVAGTHVQSQAYHRQLEKSTLVLNASAPHQSEPVDRKQPTNYSRLKAMVSDVLEDQQQNSLPAHKEQGRVKDRAIRVAPVKNTRLTVKR